MPDRIRKPKSTPPGQDQQLQVLIVSNVFAPAIGGAGAVPQALATCLPANMSVLAQKPVPPAPPIHDFKVFDRRFPFPVYRVRSLFTKISPGLPPKLRAPLQFAYNYLCTRPNVVLQLLRIVSGRRVQVVCINTLPAGYWMPNLFQRLKPRLKFIFYLHGEELSGGKAPTRSSRLMCASLATADAVVAVSSYTARLAAAQGVRPEKIAVINNGVDLDRFSPGPKDPDLQARFGLDGKHVLLCLARLDERKGQDRLIEAMPAILAAVPETLLLLVGPDDYDGPRLRDLVHRLHLQHAVVFAGTASDPQVLQYYRTADIYVMPNRTTEDGDTEGFGLVFLEAGACAKPVIGGRAGGVPDAILDGKTGYLVDGQSTQSIAEACIRLLADPDLAARMGQAGLHHARASSWASKAESFLRICDAVARDEPLPASQSHPGFSP